MPGVHRTRVGAASPKQEVPAPDERVRHHERKRTLIQLATAALTNGYVIGFAEGKVFGGATKAACVPWLNCYSCPGALGSCPVGALQTVLGGRGRSFSFYVLGLLVLFGVVLGRLVCGFCCPFGFVQDLLHRIPVPKLRVPHRLDRALRWLKYVVAVVLVVALPLVAKGDMGQAPPFFCAYLCPAGTLEGALPLMVASPQLRALVGFVFSWKMVVLVCVVVASMLVRRPFCRYLCPLGAFYGLFHRVSLYQMRLDATACVGCHRCEKVCPMGLDPERELNGPECIRCGACKATCPTTAISSGWELRAREALASAPAQ